MNSKTAQLQEGLLDSQGGDPQNSPDARRASGNFDQKMDTSDLQLEKQIKSIKKVENEDSDEQGHDEPVLKKRGAEKGPIVDFESRFKEHTARTEKAMPYTLTQVEDVMYLDQHTIVTLELHYYQRKCKYTMLSQIEEFEDQNGKWVDADGNEIHHQLGTHNYQDENLLSQNGAEHIHPMSAFGRDHIRNYRDSKVDIAEYKNSQRDPRFMVIKDRIQEMSLKFIKRSGVMKQNSLSDQRNPHLDSKLDLAQAVIATYKVNQQGGMRRFNETQVLMGRNFSISKDGNMTLTRSRDKSLISLLNFDRQNQQGRFFKLLAWTVKLKPIPVSEVLNEALSKYYQNNAKFFDKLVEVCFVGRQDFVMLTYIEKIRRLKQESEEYKIEIKEMKIRKTNFVRKLKDIAYSSSVDEKIEFRKAKKYVFFDAQTGEIVLTYGGVSSVDIFMKGRDDNKVQIYLLDMVIKEIREEKFESYLQCFFAGDFLSQEEKIEAPTMKWGMGIANIPLRQLLQFRGDPNSQFELVKRYIQNVISEKRFENQNHYLFHPEWILSQRFNWEMNIDIACSRRCDQFAIIYSPQESLDVCQKVIYVNGSKYRVPQYYPSDDESMEESNQQSKQMQTDLTTPFFQRLQSETTYRHVRNYLLKDQIFYSATRGGRTEIFCIRLDHEDPTQRHKSSKIIVKDNLLEPDVYMFYERDLKLNNSIDIFQTVSVSQGDQRAHLKTRRQGDPGIIERWSSTFCQQQGDFPCIAYNLGDSKIVIQNILQEQDCHQQFILDLEPDERFICFVDFNDFMDIGFFPDDLQIELSSRFLFLTTGRSPCGDQIIDNQLNLLFVDSYYFEIQVALFKSSSLFDNTIIKHNDFIIKACAQSTKGKKKDKSYSSGIWAQFPDRILKSRIVTEEMINDEGELDEDQCSDQEEQEGNSDSESHNKVELDQVPMLQDNKEFIYYVTKHNGICTIMEANPRDQKLSNHYPIFSTTCERCLGFDLKDQNTFFFASSDSTILMLKRCETSRELGIETELRVKEMNRVYFGPSPFSTVILREMYAVKASKILYLYDYRQPPYPDGILEAEDVLGVCQQIRTQKPTLVKGPTTIRGSTLLFDIFMHQKTNCFIKILTLPDSTEQTLINDNQETVDMSSFLDDGKILVRTHNRFMAFERDGKFIDEVEFNNDALEDIDRDYQKPQRRMTLSKFRAQSSKLAVKKQRIRPRGARDLPILDFNGYPYEINQRGNNCNRKTVYDKDKMEVLQISQNNKFYLFFNHETQRIFVYELCEVGMIATKGKENFLNTQNLYDRIKQKMRREFEFVMRYEIKYDDSDLFQFLYKIDIDPLEYFVKGGGVIKMDWKGNVMMCYVDLIDKEALNESEIVVEYSDKPDPTQATQRQDNQQAQVRNTIIGAIFEKGKKKQCTVFNFKDEFDFPKAAQSTFNQINMKKMRHLEMKLEKIRQRYSRLPKKLYDYQEYENVIDDLLELEDKMRGHHRNVNAKFFYDNLVIVYFGQFLKFGFIERGKVVNENYFEFTRDEDDVIFKDINLKFSSDVEILKIVETSEINRVQIVAKDHHLKILKIISWDFNDNIEFGMMQLQLEDHGINHLIKGINQKCNYFLTPLHLTDLEHNIPIRQANLDQNLVFGHSYKNQISKLDAFVNQRKLCPFNNSFLGIEKPGSIFHSLSRIDIIYWLSVQQTGMNEKVISQTCTLDMFNLTVKGKSLFHYFAHIAPIIESVVAKINFARLNDRLTPKQANLPLQIINPDREGKTALFHALSSQSPKSLELMVSLLHGFDDYAVTKMMLEELPQIMKSHSMEVISFFDQAVFIPQQMKVLQFIPWNEDLEEIIFPSHTSYVYRDLLIERLAEEGIHDVRRVAEPQKRKPRGVNLNQRRSLQLDAEKAHDDGCLDVDEESQLKKVAIEAMDLDWIFYRSNAKELLHLLAENGDTSYLTQKCIRVFVHIMWEHYQKAIIKFIFIPYILYLSLLSYLGSVQIGSIVNGFYRDKDDEEANRSFYINKVVTYLILVLCSCLWISFASLEAGQMVENGIGYLSDYWNCIDAVSMILNFIFLWMSTINCVLEREYFAISSLHNIGGFVAFFMWIKVFYWMRLFANLAYYVKLIQQTITDVQHFMLMVLIILLSFASFFYIINKNFEESLDSTYFEAYTGFSPIDVIISMYCVGALGDFDTTVYETGVARYMAMLMFLLSTFLISVVFMNMLIAIMGETFSNVTSTSFEGGLSQQVVLISDHAWLVDLQDIFKGKKYIIRVAPALHNDTQTDLQLQRINECENHLSKKMEKTHASTLKRVDVVDVINRHQFQQQQKVNNNVQKQLAYFETIFAEQFLMGKQNIENKKMKKEMQIENRKKSALMKELSNQLEGHHVSLEDVHRIAAEWLEIADKDGNGQLDFEEFEDFFSRLEGVYVSDQVIREIFNQYDTSGDGFLSLDEFCSAIYKAVLNEMRAYGDEEDESCQQ